MGQGTRVDQRGQENLFVQVAQMVLAVLSSQVARAAPELQENQRRPSAPETKKKTLQDRPSCLAVPAFPMGPVILVIPDRQDILSLP